MWPCGQRVRPRVRWPRVRVPLWSLAGFVLCRPMFKSLATLVNSQLHFSVIIKTLSIGPVPAIEPRLHALQSSAPLTELVLTR